jgi:hypothetical protein
MDFPKYHLNTSGAVRANYNNNAFDIETSRVTEIALFISPIMINLANPVVVIINGTEVFNKKVAGDKLFLLTNFTTNFDRKALWIGSINI